MERWLHQHIFKVGWLLTHNFQTTTILYYTFFLPGIVLHEVISWLIAGILNIRAEQSIAWPQRQEIGELRLNFVRISPNIPPLRRFIITLSPLAIGMLITWHVANNVFKLDTVFRMMGSGSLSDVGSAFSTLFATTDFWLWFYLLFTVTNTMFANVAKELKNLQALMWVVAAILVSLGVVGITSATVTTVAAPFAQAFNVLLEILIFMIVVNLLMTLLLGTVESLFERVTGHSATFRKGKMITMTREDALAERAKQRQAIQNKTLKARRNAAADSGISSIYKMAFPIPGGPGRDTANSQLTLDIPKVEEKHLPTISIPPARTEQPLTPAAGLKITSPIATPARSAPKPPSVQPPAGSKPVIPTVASGIGARPPAAPISKPIAPIPSNLPIKPAPLFTDKEDEENDDEQPIASPSRFGAPSFDKPTSPINTPKPSLVDDDDDKNEEDDQPIAPANRFGASPVGKPASPSTIPNPSFVDYEDKEDEDEQDDEKPVAPTNRFVASSFGKPTSPSTTPKPSIDDDEDEEDEPPVAPANRFGASPFGKPASPTVSPKPAFTEDEEDEEDNQPAASTNRFGASPFAKPSAPIAPTRPAASSSPYGKPATPVSPARPSVSPSPFGKPLIPAPKPASHPLDDDEFESDEELPDPFDDEVAISKPAAPKNPVYNRLAAAPPPPLTSRSQPVAKPVRVTSDDDAEDTLNRLMSSDDEDDDEDFSYEADEDFYDEDDDEAASSEDD